MRKSVSDYPPNWPEIARTVKEAAGWKCIRCGHPHEPATGHTLTVHHLDLNPANCEWWNLAALCQKCHLRIQGKVIMERIWFLPHSEWFKPFVSGFYASKFGFPTDRVWVMDHLDDLIALGQSRIDANRFAEIAQIQAISTQIHTDPHPAITQDRHYPV